MNANDMKITVSVILLGLSLFTGLVLETRMGTGYTIQLVIILIGIILTAGIIFGLWMDAEWAYPLSTLVFALSLANLVWQFSATKAFLPFAFGLLVNVAGLVMCIASVGNAMSMHELETYEAGKKRKR